MKKLLVIIILLCVGCTNPKIEEKVNILDEIKKSYSENAVTINSTNLYELKDGKYNNVGTINKDVALKLKPITITEDTKYFGILDSNYYIKYQDVKTSNEVKSNNSYSKYIPFNEDIVTKEITSFYDEKGLVYKMNKSFTLPILIKEKDKYGVIYLNKLYYINKEDVSKVIKNNKKYSKKTTGIRALVYHKFYKDNDSCSSVICLKESVFEKQIKYLYDNKYYSVTMKDLEMFVDGKINLPKNSIIITIDDGGKNVKDIAFPILEKYKMNSTLFLITSKYKKEDYQSPYVELHSHSHNLHTRDVCPDGKYGGGGIRCLDRDIILKDLRKSSKLLNNSKVFCYPFYEYNDYAISLLKEAGYVMAFENVGYKIEVGADKYKLSRYTILQSDSFTNFIEMVK